MRWIVPLCICVGAVLLIAVTLIKFMPMFSAMFATDISADPENTIYPISYVFQHPLQTIYILWNTVIQCSDTILRGLLGGKLSWLDINIIPDHSFTACKRKRRRPGFHQEKPDIYRL